jgi:two-component system OmpR family sensor kinase
MRLSVRHRFALLSALLVLVVGSLVALGGYLTLRDSLIGQAERQAGAQASQLAALVDAPGASEARNLVDLSDASLTRDFVAGGVLVRVARSDGSPVQSSRGAQRVVIGPGMRAACLAGGAASARQSDPPLAVACRLAGPRTAPAGLILVGAPLAAALASLAGLRDALLIGLGVGVMLAALAALLLARRALEPARRIARTAESIRSGDLSRRIGYRGPRDELGALAEVLDECFAELEQAVVRQRRFVADASHELKTPLAAVRAHAELLSGWAAVDPDARRTALASMDQATRRMGRLVADLLYLTELDRAPPDARLPVALDEVLLAVVAEAGPLRPEVPIRVRRLDDATITGDAVRLQALLANLIDNALRVSPQGAEVEVALAIGTHAIVTVRDHGPGIPPAALEQVFERFYRADTRDGRNGGTGLGLAIARGIARGHGGELTAANEPDGGATLTLSLPTTNPHRPVTDLLSDPISVPVMDESNPGGR